MKLRKTDNGFEILDSVGDSLILITSKGEMYSAMWKRLTIGQENYIWNWVSKQVSIPFELEVLIPFDTKNPFGIG